MRALRNSCFFVSGLLIAWALFGATVQAATITTAPFGGTGFGTYVRGDLLEASTTKTFFRLPLGSAGKVLYSIGGLAAWAALSTSDVSEGSNLYYTSARDIKFSTTSADYWVGTKSTSDIAEGSNLYYTSARDIRFSTTSADYWDSTKWRWATSSSDFWYAQQAVPASFSTTSAAYWFTTKSTSDLAEGSNLYYTAARDIRFSTTSADYWVGTYSKGFFFSTTSADAWEATKWRWATSSTDYWLTTKSTSDIAEGSNLFYTAARVNTLIDASSTVPHIGGTAWGDMLQWNGSSWVTAATSTLGITSGGGANAGTAGQAGYYATDGSTLSGTSTLFFTSAGRVSVGTTTPLKNFQVYGTQSGGDTAFIRKLEGSQAAPVTALNLASWSNVSTNPDLWGTSIDFWSGNATTSAGDGTLGKQLARISGETINGNATGALFLGVYAGGVQTRPYLFLNASNSAVEVSTTTNGTGAITIQSFSSCCGILSGYSSVGALKFYVADNGSTSIATTTQATTFNVGGSGYFSGGLGVGTLNTNAGTLVAGSSTLGQITGSGSPVTHSFGAGAGTSPTLVQLVGAPNFFVYNIKTGTTPTGSSAIIDTFTMPYACPTGTLPVRSSGNANTAALGGGAYGFASSTGPSTFVLVSGVTALGGSTNYIWNFYVGCY